MSDYMVRAIAADGQIRAFAATTRELVEEARQRHATYPVATAALGRLLTAGVMMGSMMKGDKDLLTLQIKCSGPIGGLTVTADTHGNVNGFVKALYVEGRITKAFSFASFKRTKASLSSRAYQSE